MQYLSVCGTYSYFVEKQKEDYLEKNTHWKHQIQVHRHSGHSWLSNVTSCNSFSIKVEFIINYY